MTFDFVCIIIYLSVEQERGDRMRYTIGIHMSDRKGEYEGIYGFGYALSPVILQPDNVIALRKHEGAVIPLFDNALDAEKFVRIFSARHRKNSASDVSDYTLRYYVKKFDTKENFIKVEKHDLADRIWLDYDLNGDVYDRFMKISVYRFHLKKTG